MCGDLVSDATLLHIVLLRQTQVLLRRDIAQHARAVITRGCRADTTGDVVVAWKDVRDERTEHIERRAVADRALQFHVEFDLIERHMTRTFDHHLHAHAPCAFGEFADGFEFRKLRAIGCVSETTWTKSVTNGEGDIVTTHHFANFLPARVHRILFVVHEHPLRKQRTAA